MASAPIDDTPTATSQVVLSIFDRLAIPVWEWNARTGALYLSPGWKSLLGYRDDELTNDASTYLSLLHPEDAKSRDRNLQAIMANGSDIGQIERRYRHKDGSYRWLLAKVSVERDSTGNVETIAGVSADVTQYRRLEHDLTSSRDAMRQAQRLARTGHWIWHPDGESTEWRRGTVTRSDTAAALYGLSPAESSRSSVDLVDNLVHADDRDSVKATYALAADPSCSGYDFEFRIVRPDGEIRTLHELAEFERHADGRVIQARGTIQDVTDRKRIERALIKGEQYYRSVLEEASDAFVLMSIDGKIVEWNSSAQTIFGWSREEAVGQKFGDIAIPESHRAAHEKGLAKYAERPDLRTRFTRRDLVAMRRNGAIFPVEVTVWPLDTDDGVVFCGYIRDLSELRELESNLRQAFKMETLGQITGGVAHDFNNLLLVILGTAEMLQEAAETPPHQKAAIEQIIKASELGSSLIQRLMAFARRQPLKPMTIELNRMVADMLPMMQRSIGERTTIEFVAHRDMCNAFVDSAQLSTAILNLAINSRDAMPNGGTLRIEVRKDAVDTPLPAATGVLAPGAYVSIKVTDNGSGILPEDLPRVFEPFFTTKEVGKGSGLGLSMVYGFLKQSGGHAMIDSAPGKGTTVLLCFPEDARPADASKELPANAGGGNETVLVVEDNPEVRVLTTSMVRSLGYRVLEASNATMALLLLDQRKDIDVIFSDIVMPGEMNGQELAKLARTKYPGMRILLCSGNPAESLDGDTPVKGVAFLAKPFRRDALAKKLREVLDAVR